MGCCATIVDTSSTVPIDGDDVSATMLRLVDVLFPQSGVVQIVEDRLLAGGALLLVLHPHNCVLHAKIENKLKG